MEFWEYRTVKATIGGVVAYAVNEDQFDETFNELGRTGWELVSVAPVTVWFGFTRYLVCTFKRPKRK